MGTDLSVLMIDLDHLRAVNNNYGHLAGDLLIQAVGDLLQEVVGDDGVRLPLRRRGVLRAASRHLPGRGACDG